jgi:hypothetical protein
MQRMKAFTVGQRNQKHIHSGLYHLQPHTTARNIAIQSYMKPYGISVSGLFPFRITSKIINLTHSR